MICLWKVKIILLRSDLSLKRKHVFVAIGFVLISAKLYFTTYFTIGTPSYSKICHFTSLHNFSLRSLLAAFSPRPRNMHAARGFRTGVSNQRCSHPLRVRGSILGGARWSFRFLCCIFVLSCSVHHVLIVLHNQCLITACLMRGL